MAADPMHRFNQLLEHAEQAGIVPHNAFCLATAGNDGQPSARMLLLKGADDRGLVFYTNLESDKARQLTENPRAAACFFWKPLEQQVRFEGQIELVTPEEADAYFATRPRASQIGAWASDQSREIASREKLLAAVAKYEERFKNQPVPRPPHWSGYRLIPERIEFWKEQPDRLHERKVFVWERGAWSSRVLAP